MDNLDAELWLLLLQHNEQQKERTLASPDIGEEEANNPIDIVLEHRGNIDALKTAGFRLRTEAGLMAYGTIDINQLAELAAHEQIIRIEKPPQIRLCLDKSISDIRANDSSVRTRSGSVWSGITGKDVIIGIIDTGIDYQHKVFRKADGNTRILSIWDQTLEVENGEHAPNDLPTTHPLGAATLNYGVEYTFAQIDNALDSSKPFDIVRHKDEHGHGTHVASIACGNGSEVDTCHNPYVYVGVAPEADIIVVRNRGLTDGDTDSSSADLTEAIRYLENQAAILKKPLVINLSVADLFGERDGTQPTAKHIDDILTQHEQRRAADATLRSMMVVIGAANQANKKLHAEGIIQPNQVLSLIFKVAFPDTASRKIMIRYQEAALSVSVISPDGTTDPFSGNISRAFPNINRKNPIAIVKKAGKIDILFYNPNGAYQSSGIWEIQLTSMQATPININAWIKSSTEEDKSAPRFDEEAEGITVSNKMTIAPSACGFKSIAVGAYGAELAAYSGRGPTSLIESSNLIRKPDLCAPGDNITSAAVLHLDHPIRECLERYCCACCKSYTDKNGTSMATPHVTGAVALMWQKNPNLTAQEIKDKLIASARHDSKTGATPNDEWGAGKLDVKAALDAVVPVAPPAPAAPPIAVPFMASRETPQYNPLQTLQERFLASPKGGYLLRVGQKHFNEIRNLINANKRVATVWHRCQGPAWLRTGFSILSMPDMVIPEAIANVKLTEAVRKLTEILTRYGSPELVKDIEMYQPDLQILRGGISVFDLAENFDIVTK